MGMHGLIALAQDRDSSVVLVNAVTNLRVPQNLGNFWTNCERVSFLGRTLLRVVSYLVS
jgi:hypothetical protein